MGNDGNCNYASTDYLCQKELAAPTKCGPGSSGSCRVEVLNNVVGYSAGKVLRIRNGRGVRRSGDKTSCPTGWKIWSPRNKNDWIKVYNALGKNINNYPKKPHLIVDVTRPANGCGGCTKYAMRSTTAQQGSWTTTDGSSWWLRDAKYNEPNGDYNCNYASTDYLCQKELAAPTKCGPGSSGSCRVEVLNNVVGYSAGKVLRIRNGRGVRRSGDKTSCPTGWKIWSPRNKNDWIKVYNALGKNINNYP